MFTMIFLFSLGLRAALLPAVGGKLGWCQSDVGNSLFGNWFLWWGKIRYLVGKSWEIQGDEQELCWFVCFTCTSSIFWDLWIIWCKWSTFLRLLMLSSTSGNFGKITLKIISNFLLYFIHVFLLSWIEQIVVWCCVMGGLGSSRWICSKWDSKHCQILVDFLN